MTDLSDIATMTPEAVRRELAERLGLKIEYCPHWPHPYSATLPNGEVFTGGYPDNEWIATDEVNKRRNKIAYFISEDVLFAHICAVFADSLFRLALAALREDKE